MARYLRIALVCFLTLAIILSPTFLGKKLTDPATYSHTIEVLDKNRTTVLSLTAASAAASAVVSAIPNDTCTPLANELSELSSCFMLILAVIYLEKYLLTIFGGAACYLLLPIGCSALLIHCFFPGSVLRSIGNKLVAFAITLLLVIPGSIWVSDQINAIYSHSIDVTVQSANAVSENFFGEMTDNSGDHTTVIDEANSLLGDVSGSVAKVIENFKTVLNRFIEAAAVMIVTTCLIPLLVVLFFVWIVKTLFNIPIIFPALPPMRKNHAHHHDENKEDKFILEE